MLAFVVLLALVLLVLACLGLVAVGIAAVAGVSVPAPWDAGAWWDNTWAAVGDMVYYVTSLPALMLSAVVAGTCAAHAVAVTLLPAWLVHSEGLLSVLPASAAVWLLTKEDAASDWLRDRPWAHMLAWPALMLMVFVQVMAVETWRAVATSGLSCLLLTTVALPALALSAGWLLFGPEDDDDDASERRRMLMLALSVAVPAGLGGAMLVACRLHPGFAGWLLGCIAAPVAYVVGLFAAFAIAALLTLVYVDTRKDVDIRSEHLAMTVLACVASAFVHATAPFICPGAHARMRLLNPVGGSSYF